MRGVELTLNGLFLGPVSHLTGFPLILNGTQEMLVGKGISIQEYTKIGKIYKIIREKGD